MTYRVSVKPGHPTGVRRRSGQVFTSVPVEVASITDEMRTDPWLQIVELPASTPTEEELAAAAAEEQARLDAEKNHTSEADGTDTAAGETNEGSETRGTEESGASRPSRASRASRR
jgi:hypothetical protein